MIGLLLGWAAVGAAALTFSRIRQRIIKKHIEEDLKENDPHLVDALDELPEGGPHSDDPDRVTQPNRRD